MNEFIKCDNWQKEIRDRILKPWYKKISHEERFIFCDKGNLATILQKEMAIDTIIQLKNNGILAIEEKIVKWPGYKYQNYTLETWSCTNTGMEHKGWMYYATCDYLFYCFLQEDNESLVVHSIPFKELQQWFFKDNKFESYYAFRTEQINHTETRIVPIVDVWDAIPKCKLAYITNIDILF